MNNFVLGRIFSPFFLVFIFFAITPNGLLTFIQFNYPFQNSCQINMLYNSNTHIRQECKCNYLFKINFCLYPNSNWIFSFFHIDQCIWKSTCKTIFLHIISFCIKNSWTWISACMDNGHMLLLTVYFKITFAFKT